MSATAPLVVLTGEPLRTDPLLGHVTDPEHGGTVVFSGTTRRDAGHDEVVALDYEAYAEMALPEMERIAREAQARYGARVAVAHRTGRVAVGEPSVIVAAAAGHRPAAFAACRHVIDALKDTVPIWKREVRADGRTAWQDGLEAPAPAENRKDDG